MTLKRKVFNKISDIIILVLGLNKPNQFYQAFLSKIDAVQRETVNGTEIVFDANKELHLYRAKVFKTKEPETIEWINSFKDNDVFYDIGANVGVFSLYAALHRNCDVYAFEPESKNYACLHKNLYLNKLGKKVKAFNIALHNDNCVDYLYLHGMESGAALHSVGDPIDWKGEEYSSKYEQSVLAFTLDDFINTFKLPMPNHIKIDVDGNELKILQGSNNVLKSHDLKSISIELTEEDSELRGYIEEYGFKFISKRYAKTKKELEALGLGNYLFIRAED